MEKIKDYDRPEHRAPTRARRTERNGVSMQRDLAFWLSFDG